MTPRFHSVSLYDQPYFEWQAILRQVHQTTQTDLELYKVKCIPYVLLPTSHKFPSVSLYDHHFAFWDNCTEWPQNDFEPRKVKCISYVLLVP